MKQKGQIWISAIIYVLVAVAITVLVLEAGLPLLNNLQERNAFTRIKDNLAALDKHVEDVAGEGQGSRRLIPLEVTDGEIRFESQVIRWKLESERALVTPGSRTKQGNLVVGTGVDVTASEKGSFFILENGRISANFTRYGAEGSFVPINTNDILNSITFKNTGDATSGVFSFTLNSSNASTVGSGFTILEEKGTGLSTASLRAHINSSIYSYDIIFTLESEADFVTTEIENLRAQ